MCMDSDSESSVSYIVGTDVVSDSHSSSLTYNYMGHEVVSLTDDSGLERASGNSLDERDYSLDSF